ncbi:hypothetical protein [Nocardioides alkalitolerans]|uniref:hypothetical protein n=1 Tax=Nocardioides alkalitolerans TaxID=281714 RepID=UPI0012FC37F1|nr:hypothetical protein [Nocardioides alkalitolerans]
MVESAGERQWMKGYEAARSLCLTRGAETAHRQRPLGTDPAYEAGWDWGLWDYEDANGLPHVDDRGA